MRYRSSDYRDDFDMYEEIKTHRRTKNIQRKNQNTLREYYERYYEDEQDLYDEEEVEQV